MYIIHCRLHHADTTMPLCLAYIYKNRTIHHTILCIVLMLCYHRHHTYTHAPTTYKVIYIV